MLLAGAGGKGGSPSVLPRGLPRAWWCRAGRDGMGIGTGIGIAVGPSGASCTLYPLNSLVAIASFAPLPRTPGCASSRLRPPVHPHSQSLSLLCLTRRPSSCGLPCLFPSLPAVLGPQGFCLLFPLHCCCSPRRHVSHTHW